MPSLQDTLYEGIVPNIKEKLKTVLMHLYRSKRTFIRFFYLYVYKINIITVVSAFRRISLLLSFIFSLASYRSEQGQAEDTQLTGKHMNLSLGSMDLFTCGKP